MAENRARARPRHPRTMAITVSGLHDDMRVRRCSGAPTAPAPFATQGVNMPQDIVEIEEVPAEELPEFALLIDIPFED
ncbi:hypothetical protein ACFQ2B_04810 [Streptomyces stramineus]|uniref:Uncharacterized protein n=1 Tax=Streptomyces stramineus TaxID=173861 RepID=A0ABP3JC29_9ACTN